MPTQASHAFAMSSTAATLLAPSRTLSLGTGDSAVAWCVSIFPEQKRRERKTD
jgi:hypothetical protein